MFRGLFSGVVSGHEKQQADAKSWCNLGVEATGMLSERSFFLVISKNVVQSLHKNWSKASMKEGLD